MQVKANRLTRAYVVSLLLFAGASHPSMAKPKLDFVSQKEGFELAQWRREALHGDRTHVPQMIEGLHSSHSLYLYTALHALAHLGATDALPTMEAMLTTYPATDFLNAYIHASIARLQAEAEMPTLPTAAPVADSILTPAQQANAQARGKAKLERFFALASTTPQEIGTAVSAFTQRKAQLLREGRREKVERPQEIAALHEIADLLYREPSLGVQAKQMFPDLEFAADFGVELKVKLAGMSHMGRIAWLVNDLSQKKMGKTEDNYEIQLAVDEGMDASNAAAAKLKEMDGQRNKYSPEGFRTLLYVLDGVGDKAQAPLVRHFVDDKDERISNTAGIRGGVSQGQGNQYMAGY